MTDPIKGESTEIQNIVVIVHPLFFAGLTHWSLIHRDPQTRKNIRFLLGRWGKEINAAAHDPHTVVVFVSNTFTSRGNESVAPYYSKEEGWRVTVKSDPKNESSINHRKIAVRAWVDQQSKRLREHAEKVMGERFFHVEGEISSPEKLLRELEERNMRVGKNISGRAFGEYYGLCVNEAQRAVEQAIQPRIHTRFVGRIQRIPQLSLSGNFYPEDMVNKTKALGTGLEDLRKAWRKRHRRKR